MDSVLPVVPFVLSDKVIRTLGEGTFGKVVECEDLQRYVAYQLVAVH